MTHSTTFSVTIYRNDEEIEIDVEGTAYATGYNNADCGGGGALELDCYDLDEQIELSKEEEEAVSEAAQEALIE